MGSPENSEKIVRQDAISSFSRSHHEKADCSSASLAWIVLSNRSRIRQPGSTSFEKAGALFVKISHRSQSRAVTCLRWCTIFPVFAIDPFKRVLSFVSGHQHPLWIHIMPIQPDRTPLSLREFVVEIDQQFECITLTLGAIFSEAKKSTSAYLSK
jgi:hypothetical protein